MTLYLGENEAKAYKLAVSILLKFMTLESDISRTIWHVEVIDGSFFCIFHALPFKLNLPFKKILTIWDSSKCFPNNHYCMNSNYLFKVLSFHLKHHGL